jgi:glycosyltransferase involved in cell wall biosynthesis
MLLWRTLQVALAERPDVIHAHLHEGALIGTIVGRLLRRPVLFDFQGSMTAEMVDHRFLSCDSPWYRPLRWLEGRIIRWPQAVATSSYNAARVLRDDFAFPEERLFTVPDGVNTANFRPLDDVAGWSERRVRLRAMLGIPADARVVVYLGLLAPYQGTDVLLEAACRVLQELPDSYFLVMGFPGVESYAQKARALGILGHTLFPGRISYFEAPRGLALGDVAVAPKMSATEGSGKICDYMAMALPVVAFDTPVGREMLGDLGRYAEYGSADSLARCLVQSLRDVEGGRALGLRLRARAEALFSWAQSIRRIEDIYARIGARQSLNG